MKVICVYSDLYCFSHGEVYLAKETGLDSCVIEGYYGEEGWDGLIKLDGHSTKFKIVEY